ncbi:Tripartite tricarboxylate transporter TctA family protein [Caballeronia udeis]|uniref:Tripartite tricarboxylate transporter TctA family protein n=1 Tax=Caballeronia udeis TaxID=1232866 RepID=A0A158I5D0_9BURK|nr:tripartite tricarboxylate transporter permease [Caballeronia udeis]SAL51469.1 Tripartite tricarboxylate transporter TctA family protein [Caballeronia udeis]
MNLVHDLHNLMGGFGVALSPMNFLYCLIGASLGTMVGVLPGLGPVTTIAMLLPLTFKMPAVSSFIMLSGIYYGAHHAGSTTAIMLNMPGEPTSVVVCFDGHPMARQGRAGAALSIAALGSFFAGCVAVIVIALFSPLLAQVALDFRAPEYTSMVILALLAAAVLTEGSLINSIAMVTFGLLLGTVGTDVNSGRERFTFGLSNIASGIDFVAIAVGLFAIAEIVSRLRHAARKQSASADGAHHAAPKFRSLFPTRRDFAMSWKPILRGTALGSAFGILPGTGPLVSSFASYSLERQIAKDPSRFGKGAIEGVAGPESANNSAALTHFIPMLTLGIPAGAAMALMLGALTIQGISPGPMVMTEHPDLFWGVVASMLIGNVMLLVLNLPMIGVWIKLLTIPYRFLYPCILVFCCIGVYSISNSPADVVMTAAFGVFGYVMLELGCRPAPLILGFILGPILEANLRTALVVSRGNPMIFVQSPISLGFLLVAAALLVAYATSGLRRREPRVANSMEHDPYSNAKDLS